MATIVHTNEPRGCQVEAKLGSISSVDENVENSNDRCFIGIRYRLHMIVLWDRDILCEGAKDLSAA